MFFNLVWASTPARISLLRSLPSFRSFLNFCKSACLWPVILERLFSNLLWAATPARISLPNAFVLFLKRETCCLPTSPCHLDPASCVCVCDWSCCACSSCVANRDDSDCASNTFCSNSLTCARVRLSAAFCSLMVDAFCDLLFKLACICCVSCSMFLVFTLRFLDILAIWFRFVSEFVCHCSTSFSSDCILPAEFALCLLNSLCVIPNFSPSSFIWASLLFDSFCISLIWLFFAFSSVLIWVVKFDKRFFSCAFNSPCCNNLCCCCCKLDIDAFLFSRFCASLNSVSAAAFISRVCLFINSWLSFLFSSRFANLLFSCNFSLLAAFKFVWSFSVFCLDMRRLKFMLFIDAFASFSAFCSLTSLVFHMFASFRVPLRLSWSDCLLVLAVFKFFCSAFFSLADKLALFSSFFCNSNICVFLEDILFCKVETFLRALFFPFSILFIFWSALDKLLCSAFNLFWRDAFSSCDFLKFSSRFLAFCWASAAAPLVSFLFFVSDRILLFFLIRFAFFTAILFNARFNSWLLFSFSLRICW